MRYLLVAFMSGCKTALQIFTAVTIGHMAQRHVTLCSLAAYIGVLIFETTIGNLALRMGIKTPMMITYMMEHSDNHATSVMIILLTLAVFCAIYFAFCDWLLKHKLNLA